MYVCAVILPTKHEPSRMHLSSFNIHALCTQARTHKRTHKRARARAHTHTHTQQVLPPSRMHWPSFKAEGLKAIWLANWAPLNDNLILHTWSCVCILCACVFLSRSIARARARYLSVYASLHPLIYG